MQFLTMNDCGCGDASAVPERLLDSVSGDRSPRTPRPADVPVAGDSSDAAPGMTGIGKDAGKDRV